MVKIYCAGPLFNKKEQEEMAEIASAIEEIGYKTFLPQRDGLELAKIRNYLTVSQLNDININEYLEKSIFALDIYHLLTSNAVIINVNGRVPDEGAMVEAGAAWASGIPIVLYKNDSRSVFDGRDNPMLFGLANYEYVNSIEKIPEKISKAIKKDISIEKKHCEKTFSIGEKIAKLLENEKTEEQFVFTLISLFKEDKHECARAI